MLDNAKVCEATLREEIRNCTLVQAWTSWGPCDANCERHRTPKCMCGTAGHSTDGESQPFLVSPSMCGMSDRDEDKDCDREEIKQPWGECDPECTKSREVTCRCSENNVILDSKECGLTAEESLEEVPCTRKLTEWVKEECPAETQNCVEFAPKSRDCICSESDNPFKIEDHRCGNSATKGSHVCDYSCKCSVKHQPIICPRTVDACFKNSVTGQPPVCECYPEWHKGTCDENLMEISEVMDCPIIPSEWEEWGKWSECSPETCKKTRNRICLCCPEGEDGARIPTDLCDGPAVEYKECEAVISWSQFGECDLHCSRTRFATCNCEDAKDVDIARFCDLDVPSESEPCSTNWTPWMNYKCPAMQMEGQCTLSSKRFRDCLCVETSRSLEPHYCAGDNKSDYPCPVPEPCQCEWVPILTTCPRELSCAPQVQTKEYDCKCTPEWFGYAKWGGQCTEPKPEGPDSLCEATAEYDWSQWSPWGECDNECEQSRSRSCSCLGDVDDNACGNGKSVETKSCASEWTEWEGTCPLCCVDKEFEQTRSCLCKENSSAKNLVGRCDGSSSKTINCPGKEYNLGPWQPWAPRDMDMACMCMTERSRLCQCFSDDPSCDPYVADATRCTGEGEKLQQKLVDVEWTGWSEPECGGLECGYKVRPSYRYIIHFITLSTLPNSFFSCFKIQLLDITSSFTRILIIFKNPQVLRV